MVRPYRRLRRARHARARPASCQREHRRGIMRCARCSRRAGARGMRQDVYARWALHPCKWPKLCTRRARHVSWSTVWRSPKSRLSRQPRACVSAGARMCAATARAWVRMCMCISRAGTSSAESTGSAASMTATATSSALRSWGRRVQRALATVLDSVPGACTPGSRARHRVRLFCRQEAARPLDGAPQRELCVAPQGRGRSTSKREPQRWRLHAGRGRAPQPCAPACAGTAAAWSLARTPGSR